MVPTMVPTPEIPRSSYVAGSAAIQAIIDENEAIDQRLGTAIADVDAMVVRAADEDEDVIVGVTGRMAIADVYLEPGITDKYSPQELAEVFTHTARAASEAVTEKTREIRTAIFLPEAAVEN